MLNKFIKIRNMTIEIEMMDGKVCEIEGTKKINLFKKFSLREGGFITLKGDYGTRYLDTSDIKKISIIYEGE